MRPRAERNVSPPRPATGEARDAAPPAGSLVAATIATPEVALALQRSAGNAAVARQLLLRNGGPPLAPPPSKPPDTSRPPAPTAYADRGAFIAGVTAPAVKVEDDWGGLQFLNAQSLEEMASIARELLTGHRNVVERLCRGVGGAPAIYHARVRFVLEAALKRGQMGRQAFAAEQTAIIVALTTADAAGVEKVLDLLG